MKKIAALALSIGLIAQSCSPALAATATQTFSVQITLTAQCVFSAAPAALNFGTTGVLAANTDATTTMNVQCTNTTPYTIGLDAGGGTGATIATRKMTNGTATINYAL